MSTCSSDLRPTLFLAQLSNLLAGNISIVHGVVGSSRTFMGEEASGADAVRVACARIAAGQGDLFLVGGSYNAQRPDIAAARRDGSVAVEAAYRRCLGASGGWRWHGAGLRGLFPGDRELRARRQARHARDGAHRGTRHRSLPASVRRGYRDRRTAACDNTPSSAATACRRDFRRHRRCSATAEEMALLGGLGLPVRGTATAVGHSLEPSFPANLALAALSLSRRRLFAPLEPDEQPMTDELRQVLVTSWGHWRGEALAVVEAG